MRFLLPAFQGATHIIDCGLVVASTQFVKSGAAASMRDLKIGDRVVIHANPNGDKLEASSVDFGKPAMGKMNQ